MTSFSPSFSALTTNPDGRNGRSPTTVLISRSGDTTTGTRSQPLPARGIATCGRIRLQPEMTPQVPARAVMRRNLRRFTHPPKQNIKAEGFERLYTFVLAEILGPCPIPGTLVSSPA